MFTVYSLCIIIYCAGCLAVSATNMNAQTSRAEQVSQRYLVLGGNGFMGSALVTRLLSPGKHVTILNRGNWYFDSRSRVEPFVKRVLCDRSNIYACDELVNSTQYYDAVIDFTSFYGEDIKVSKCDLKLAFV